MSIGLTHGQIVDKIIKYFYNQNPQPKCPLYHNNMYEIFISAMLSPQMTDVRLNKITPVFFEKFSNFEAIYKSNVDTLSGYLKSVNFYKTKVKNIYETTKVIIEKYNGKIPDTVEELVKLPGIGKKVANVIVNDGFGKNIQGIVVDTHVKRVTNRLGIELSSDPLKIENTLKNFVPYKYWRNISLWFIYHGKDICKAKNPKCSECEFSKFCKYNIESKS